MRTIRSTGLIRRIFNRIRSAIQNQPLLPDSQKIDREYIEGETLEEIEEISQMTNIPDKAERHPARSRRKSKASRTRLGI